MAKLISTDGMKEEAETDNARHIKFAKDMTEAGIAWRWYSGRFMYGAKCPASVTYGDVTEEDIIRATTVKGLKMDTLGRGRIIYPGL